MTSPDQASSKPDSNSGEGKSKGKKEPVPSKSPAIKVIKKKKPQTAAPETLEPEIARIEVELNELSAQMSDPEVARDATRLISLSDKYQQTEERLKRLYEKWESLSAEAANISE